MTISIRGAFAATLLAGSALAATPAFADEPAKDFTISGNASLVSDYRFRGISQTLGDAAIQGGITATHSSGFYVGTWASSILVGTEIDLFGGWSGEVTPGITVDGGLLYYVYPTLNKVADANYFEPYLSVKGTVGPATIKVGGNYSWGQSAIADHHNLYLYTNVDVAIPSTPVTVSGHVGYVDGFGSTKGLNKGNWDYSIGASATVYGPLSVGVTYVGMGGPSVEDLTNDSVLGTITASF